MEELTRIQEDQVHVLARRLAENGQELAAWVEALREQGGADDRSTLERQLLRAVKHIASAVRVLSATGREQLAEAELTAALDFPHEEDELGSADFDGLRGHSRAITIPELLGFVSNSYKSGILRVRTPDERFVVQLKGGWVVFAQGDHPPKGQHLGDILVAQGVLTSYELDGFLEDKGRRSGLLGQRLLREGLITKEALQSALACQAQYILNRLCAASEARFWFYERARIKTDEDIRLNIIQLLLESARAEDEAAARASGYGTPASKAARGEPEARVAGPTASEDLGARFRARLERRIEDGSLELPILGDTAKVLLSLCMDESVDAETLKDHIIQDQALCAHILHVANSAAYAPAVPIVSVQLAIARLGLDTIRDIALGVALRQEVFEVPGWEDLVRSLWKDAVITSGFAKTISALRGGGSVRAGTFGLLQNIGKPVVLHSLLEIQAELGCELGRALALELMEEYHAGVGAMLARKWSMPDWLEAVTLHHHDHPKATQYRLEAMIAHLADELAARVQAQEEVDAREVEGLAVCTELNLSPPDVDSLLEETQRILQVAEIYA